MGGVWGGRSPPRPHLYYIPNYLANCINVANGGETEGNGVIYRKIKEIAKNAKGIRSRGWL